MSRYSLWIVVLLMAASCSGVPGNVPKPAKMQDIIYDLMKADEVINGIPATDSVTNKKEKRSILYQQVFDKHSISRKDFYTSYQYYQQHPDLHKQVFDSLVNRLTLENKTLQLPKKARPLRHPKTT